MSQLTAEIPFIPQPVFYIIQVVVICIDPPCTVVTFLRRCYIESYHIRLKRVPSYRVSYDVDVQQHEVKYKHPAVLIKDVSCSLVLYKIMRQSSWGPSCVTHQVSGEHQIVSTWGTRCSKQVSGRISCFLVQPTHSTLLINPRMHFPYKWGAI